MCVLISCLWFWLGEGVSEKEGLGLDLVVCGRGCVVFICFVLEIYAHITTSLQFDILVSRPIPTRRMPVNLREKGSNHH